MSHNLDWCVECGMPHHPEADCYNPAPGDPWRRASETDQERGS